MTKKKLEKEAEKWLRKYLLCCNCEKKCNCIDSNSYCEEQVLKSYVAGAEPREKRIQIDAEQIRALQKQNGELTDKVKDLEAQIEKMKYCYNCSKWNDGQCADIPSDSYCCADFVCDKWEIKENE